MKKNKSPIDKKVESTHSNVEKKQKEPKIKCQTTFSLQLTRFELLHLRDLMGVLLPPDGSQTISQALAAIEERSLIESMLWEKVAKFCIDAELPVDATAPDYIIAPTAPPPLGIFQVNQDLTSKSSIEVGFLSTADETKEE